jgi:hypothetical protein
MKNLHDEDDKLFVNLLQERLRKIEVAPDELVWTEIENGIRKRRRRLVVIGVAAIVSFTLFVLSSFFPSSMSKQDDSARPILTNSKEREINELERRTLPQKSLTKPFKGGYVNQRLTADSSVKNLTMTLQSTKVETKIDEPFSPDAGIPWQNRNDKENNDLVVKKANTEFIAHDSVPELSDDKKNKKRRFQFYASLNPSLNYQIIKPVTGDVVLISGLSSTGVISGKRAGFGIDAGFMIPINKRFEAFVGANYFHQRNSFTYYYSPGSMELATTSGNILTFLPQTSTQQVRYDMRNIGVQSGMFFKFKQGPLEQKVGASLSYQHGLKKASQEMIYNNSKSSYLFMQLHYRFDFSLNRKLKMFIQPTQSYSIWNSENFAAFKLTPYRVSINFGLVYTFKNKNTTGTLLASQ